MIERLARELGATCIVVTSDRDLRRSVESSGAVAVYVSEFLAKMRMDPAAPDAVEHDGEYEAPRRSPDGRKKGNPRRLSKAERVRRERLAKL